MHARRWRNFFSLLQFLFRGRERDARDVRAQLRNKSWNRSDVANALAARTDRNPEEARRLAIRVAKIPARVLCRCFWFQILLTERRSAATRQVSQGKICVTQSSIGAIARRFNLRLRLSTSFGPSLIADDTPRVNSTLADRPYSTKKEKKKERSKEITRLEDRGRTICLRVSLLWNWQTNRPHSRRFSSDVF